MKKRLISLLLILALIVSCFPVSALAAGNEETCSVARYSDSADLLEITRDGAPIRSGPGESYSITVTCQEGAVVEKIGSTINRYLHRWYEVTYRDAEGNQCYTGYIYSENVQKHTHQYESLVFEGLTYKYCDCGKITVRVPADSQVTGHDVRSILYSTAAALPLVDGPLPVGDMIAVGLLVVGGVMAVEGAVPLAGEVATILQDVDYYQYRQDDRCPTDSYYKVTRINGTLAFVDNKCMDKVEAYVWVRTGHDVWCKDWSTAQKLGLLHLKGCFSEIDSGNKDYWYHFHLGSCTSEGKHIDVVGGHIFYGASAITGSFPT